MSVVRLKSGGYLSSQRLTVSTFGVKELNFCVRNGNRWILFAIITAIVIYLVSSRLRYIYLFNESSFKNIHNYIANLVRLAKSYKLVKIIDSSVKDFRKKLSNLFILEIKPSTY